MNREEAIRRLKANRDAMYFPETIEALDMAIEALHELPKRRKEAKRWKTKALQAEPVKHGKWITDKDGYSVCSECGFSFGCIECPHEETDFCPNCGAKMDKEKEDDK